MSVWCEKCERRVPDGFHDCVAEKKVVREEKRAPEKITPSSRPVVSCPVCEARREKQRETQRRYRERKRGS